jgi:uncharacterized protein (DUF302 family)
MLLTPSPLSFGVRVDASVADLRPRVVAALREEGFGVLTEVDLAATLKEKLGVDRSPYLILGACNPPLANRAVDLAPSVGTLLPCNVVLRADGAGTVVEAMDPVAALRLAGVEQLEPVAVEARARLERALTSLTAG